MTEILNPPTTGKLVAALRHQTSRNYAADSVSNRALPPFVNALLLDAAAGKEVDVLAFRQAATAALDLARTRGKDRPASADYARKARHLIYWADALIRQQVEQLPVYEPGARSPRIAELEDALRIEQERVILLREELDRERAVINEKAERVDELAGNLHMANIDLAAVREQNDRYVAELGKTDERLAAYETIARNGELRALEVEAKMAVELEEVGAVLGYALELLPPCGQQRVFGFWDAVKGS